MSPLELACVEGWAAVSGALVSWGCGGRCLFPPRWGALVVGVLLAAWWWLGAGLGVKVEDCCELGPVLRLAVDSAPGSAPGLLQSRWGLCGCGSPDRMAGCLGRPPVPPFCMHEVVALEPLFDSVLDALVSHTLLASSFVLSLACSGSRGAASPWLVPLAALGGLVHIPLLLLSPSLAGMVCLPLLLLLLLHPLMLVFLFCCRWC